MSKIDLGFWQAVMALAEIVLKYCSGAKLLSTEPSPRAAAGLGASQALWFLLFQWIVVASAWWLSQQSEKLFAMKSGVTALLVAILSAAVSMAVVVIGTALFIGIWRFYRLPIVLRTTESYRAYSLRLVNQGGAWANLAHFVVTWMILFPAWASFAVTSLLPLLIGANLAVPIFQLTPTILWAGLLSLAISLSAGECFVRVVWISLRTRISL